MNPQGLVPVALGIWLVVLAVTGRYRQTWAVLAGGPSAPLPSGTRSG